MELQEWIDGKFEESETDYKIAGLNILYKEEECFLKKGVELLCDEVKPKSVLEFGFGKGWTASEFQKYGIDRHIILEPNKEVYQMALNWKESYNTNIEILNMFSWDFETDEQFDLVYDDREPFTDDDGDDNNHFAHMKNILPKEQWYSRNATITCNNSAKVPYDYAIEFILNDIGYKQHLTKGFYGNC